MTDHNPSGPTSGQWIALIVVSVVACLCIVSFGYAAGPKIDSAIADGVDRTQPLVDAAHEEIMSIRQSDPVYGPIMGDVIAYTVIGVIVALIGAAGIGWIKRMRGERDE